MTGALQVLEVKLPSPSPSAGTSHYITIAELQPARRVIKAQQRARRHGGVTQHAAGEGGDVLDVE